MQCFVTLLAVVMSTAGPALARRINTGRNRFFTVPDAEHEAAAAHGKGQGQGEGADVTAMPMQTQVPVEAEKYPARGWVRFEQLQSSYAIKFSSDPNPALALLKMGSCMTEKKNIALTTGQSNLISKIDEWIQAHKIFTLSLQPSDGRFFLDMHDCCAKDGVNHTECVQLTFDAVLEKWFLDDMVNDILTILAHHEHTPDLVEEIDEYLNLAPVIRFDAQLQTAWGQKAFFNGDLFFYVLYNRRCSMKSEVTEGHQTMHACMLEGLEAYLSVTSRKFVEYLSEIIKETRMEMLEPKPVIDDLD